MRLADYLRKIGVAPPFDRMGETLRRVHVAHRETFLFENVTIQKGGGISLALGDLERKFLDEGGGGYCFEHNTLFAAALRDLGFTVATLLARVRNGPPDRWVRTHMVLRVRIDGAPWLADVGYGGFGLIEPMPLVEGATADQGGAVYALRREDSVWILSMRDSSSVADLYEFTEDPQTAADIEVANHYTATHPDSRFRRTLTIQRGTRDERTLLRGDRLIRFRDGRTTDEPVRHDELRLVARDVFGVELPATPLVFESYATPWTDTALAVDKPSA
jgi:N-hydroxyarylamine O-acetyltransferase